MKQSTKILILSFVIILALPLASSYAQESKQLFTYRLEQEDHTTRQYTFPEGVYYSYNFSENDIDIDKLFREVFARGVQIRDAWRKPYNTSCNPPNSEAHMMVIVHPVLVIRVDKRASQIEQVGFEEIAKPAMGHCSYRVIHYTFSDK